MKQKFKKSTILRGMTRDGSARILVIDSKELVNGLIKTHKTSPTATAALGRLVSAASMIGTLLPESKDTVTVQTSTDGAIEHMLVVADYYGNVKSYIRGADANLPLKPNGKLDVSGAVGNGYLAVIRDVGGSEPQCGTTEIVSGEIAEDLAAYFAKSEQIPTLLSLGVLVDVDYTCKAAGGVLVQLMPYPDDSTVDLLERNAAELGSISRLFAEGMSCEQIADIALRDIPYDVFDTLEVEYKCDCSKARMKKKMRSIGKAQLLKMLDEQEAESGERELTAVCRFCSSNYKFTEEELISGNKR